MSTKPVATVFIERLGSSIQRGGSALENVPELLKTVLQEGWWREFATSRGQVVQYDRFADFVTTPPTAGIGATIDLIRRIVGKDLAVLNMLDRELQEPHGGTRTKKDNVQLAPDGNSVGRALRKLRKDAPKLHAEVLAGRISPHAAMVGAGFRQKTVSVPVDRPESIARTLRRHLTPADLTQLRQLLGDDPSG